MENTPEMTDGCLKVREAAQTLRGCLIEPLDRMGKCEEVSEGVPPSAGGTDHQEHIPSLLKKIPFRFTGLCHRRAPRQRSLARQVMEPLSCFEEVR